MLVTVTPSLTVADRTHILDHLRPEDETEIAAWGITPLDFMRVAADRPDTWTFHYKGTPAFVWGTVELQPGERHLWGMGTKATRWITPYATRWGRQRWIPDAFFERGTRTIYADVPVISKHSILWLRRLGMSPAGVDFAGTTMFMRLAYTSNDFARDYHVLLPDAQSCLGRSGTN